MDSRIQPLAKRGEELRLRRSQWDQLFQDIMELVRPTSNDFTSSDPRPLGREKSKHLYDGTAPWANEQLASGLHSHLTNPNERWFSLAVRGVAIPKLPRAWRLWTEDVSDLIYHEYSKSTSNFSPAIHEAYLDLGALGTCVMFQDYSRKAGSLRFTSYPLSQCYISEGAGGEVEAVWRTEYYSTVSLLDEFSISNEKDMEKVTKSAAQKQWKVEHAVFPRDDQTLKYQAKTKKPFASVYYCEELDEPLSEGGFDSFPYHVGRWTKLAGEQYGRSPASTCFPEIRQVNQMEKEIITQAMMANAPPMSLEKDGFLFPLKWKPRAILWREPGYSPPEVLDPKSKPMVALEMLQETRKQILRCFYVDWLVQEQKKERQTTVEIMDKRDEKLRMLAPILGRVQSEMLEKILIRSFQLLRARNMIPSPPEPGVELEIKYISPAAKAQFGSKIVSYQRFIEDLVPLANVDPTILQKVNMTELANELALARDVSPKIIKSEKQLEKEAAEARQMQQAQMAAEAVPQVSGAIKDVAQAKKEAPELINQFLPGV